MRRLVRFVAPFSIAVGLAACGGGQAEPKEPESPSAESPAAAESPSEKSDDKGSADDKPAAAETAKAESPAPEKEKKAGRSPKDVVMLEDALFVFSFAASEAYQAAEKKCAASAGDDPKKKADCMGKAGKQLDPDSLAFEQDADGKWWWLTVRRKGDKLVTLHKVQFEFGEEGDKGIKLKLQGPDKGTTPMGHVPTELAIEVPSEAEIALSDPKNGRMVYQAKMGLKGEQKR